MAYPAALHYQMANMVGMSHFGACLAALCALPSLIAEKVRIQRNRLCTCAPRVLVHACGDAHRLLPELYPMWSGGAYIPVVSLCADGPMKSYDSDFGENWKMQTMIDPDKPKKILTKKTMIY